MIKKKTEKKLLTGQQIDSMFSTLKIATALLISIGIILAIVLLISDQPLESLKYFFFGPFNSVRHIGNIIENITPILVTGAATCLLFSAGTMTLSGEACCYWGGCITGFIVAQSSLKGMPAKLTSVLLAIVIGAAIAVLPIIGRFIFKTDAFILSLLFSYVFLYAGTFFLKNFFSDPGYIMIASKTYPLDSKFRILIPGTNVTAAVFIALFIVALCWLIMEKTKLGYYAKMTKTNPNYAKYMGVKVGAVTVAVQMLGGAMCAVGGAIEQLGKGKRFMWVNEPGFGWDGFMIACLALQNPKNVPLAALFLAYIRTGASVMNTYTDVPLEIVNVIQAVVIILVGAQSLFSKRQKSVVIEQARLREALAIKGEK